MTGWKEPNGESNCFSLGLLYVCHAFAIAIVSPNLKPFIPNQVNGIPDATRAILALVDKVCPIPEQRATSCRRGQSSFARLIRDRQRTGWTRYHPLERFAERNPVVIQRLPGDPLQFHFGFGIRGFGGQFTLARGGQIPLG